MSVNTSFQLYIDKKVPVEDLLSWLSKELNAPIETLDTPGNGSKFLLTVEEYENRFLTGINISWSGNDNISIEKIEIARAIAINFSASVLTDLPETHPLREDPYYWCLIEPSGSMFEIAESTSALTEEDTLVLDWSTKKPLAT